jgi:uncharacterized membrane protein YjjP (DUF1212 family)
VTTDSAGIITTITKEFKGESSEPFKVVKEENNYGQITKITEIIRLVTST